MSNINIMKSLVNIDIFKMMKEEYCMLQSLGKDLEFKFFDVERGHGREPRMFVTFPDYFTKEFYLKNKEMLKKVFGYTTIKFYLRQLTCGKGIREEILLKKYPYDDHSLFLVEYLDGKEEKSAIINPMVYKPSYKIELSPCMVVFGGDVAGFTVTPGNFSDFYTYEYIGDSNRLVGHTRDFIPYMMSLTAIFLEMLMNDVKSIIIEENLPDDFESTIETHYVLNPEYRRVTDLIVKSIKDKISINSSKRIDSLTVDGKNVYDLMKEFNVWTTTFFMSKDLLRIALILGKTPKQVYGFVEKVLDKLKEKS